MSWLDTQPTNNHSLEAVSTSSLASPQHSLNLPLSSEHHSTAPKTIAFVDANVSDATTIMASLKADVKVLLDPSRDGILQITETLKQYQGLEGVEIISHGDEAEVKLGNSKLDRSSLQGYNQALQQWSTSLTSDADILFYGCNIAAGEAGASFVEKVSALTGADVAASTDLTGNAALGGDWMLEYQTGSIETSSSLKAVFKESYEGTLNTLPTPTAGLVSYTDIDNSKRFGTFSDRIEIPHAANQILTSQLTLSAWVRPDRFGDWDGLMTKGVNTSPYAMQLWSDGSLRFTANAFAPANSIGGGSWNSNTKLRAGEWTHVAVTYDGTALRFYINGTLDSNVVRTTLRFGTNTEPLVLGADLPGGDEFLRGQLDHARIYNRALSATEISTLRTNDQPPSSVSNRVGTVSVSGTPTQSQTLTATVADADGLTNATINYQWQQLTNGTWTNIAGATGQTFTLTQAQVRQQVRATATYTDALGRSEAPISTATAAIANVNDLGTVSLDGTARQGNTLTANVSDIDGLPTTINYQWQRLVNNNWTNIAGATSRNLALDSSLVGFQVRVNATYVDALGSSENLLSQPTAAIAAPITGQSLFTTQTPSILNATDGLGSAGDYELGMEFRSARAGTINAIRFWKAPSETGTHVGKIWSSTGQLLASVTFTNETASGWQQQALSTPLIIQPNTTYVVSVNTNSHYVATSNGIATTLTNGDISAVADSSNGVFNATPGSFPTNSFNNTNYFRDIVFTAGTGNIAGTASISGIPTPGSTLTANIADPNGLTGVTLRYQWQRSSDGTTWSNITGAINSTLTLDSSLVGQRVRVNAIYTDAQNNSENIFSNPTNPIAVVSPNQSLFSPTDTPTLTNVTDGSGSAGDYELGMEFRTTRAGTITAIRYYRAPGETGTHVGKIWAGMGQMLANVTFTNETASGWQEQALATPLPIEANTTYVVSVNANSHYAVTPSGLANSISKGDITAVADGSNGVFNSNPNTFPADSFNNANYFRDIVFTPASSNPNNNPGTVTLIGTTTQNQTLTARVADRDGLQGVTFNYQWQQSNDNGATWNNIVNGGCVGLANCGTCTCTIIGGTGETLTLGQAQVGNLVRVRVTYTDALGSVETVISPPTAPITNVNDTGFVTISGVTAQGNTLTATVADDDGLIGMAINYRWQRFLGDAWVNIAGATSRNLVLDSSFVGQRIRVNAIYTDALGGTENILSSATTVITAAGPSQSLFAPTASPLQTNLTDGIGSDGDYELGMEFRTATVGTISAIRFYKAPSETGRHIGRIWSSNGQLLASTAFANETASGWQEQALDTPLTIEPNTTYIVSVNANSYYVATPNGLATTITNGDISAAADGSNGVFNQTPGSFPTNSFNNANYFRDIVFTPIPANPNNIPGNAVIDGVIAEDRVLVANITDRDGISASASISYQWQELNGNTWSNIAGATGKSFTPGDKQVGKQLRVQTRYIDVLGTRETVFSPATAAVANVNDPGLSLLRGSPTVGHTLTAGIFDDDGLGGGVIRYQWQQFFNNTWTNIANGTGKLLSLDNSLLNRQVRAAATYTDAWNTTETVFSAPVNIAAFNPIVLENRNAGTRDWMITNQSLNNEIAGYASATSVNQGEPIQLKVSLAQAGQYRIDFYRLGYYGGAGGRFMGSSGVLNGGPQAGPTIDPQTRMVDYKWNTSYTLQVGNNWTSGLYIAKLTDIRTGKENQVWFSVRDDDRPANLGFQASFTTYEAYNNQGGHSLYNFNSAGGNRAYAVSFDRPFNIGGEESFNNMLSWEYNMVRWLESQGYDVSYYTNLDVHANPLQLYNQNTFLSVGHDEYWSMEMFDSIEKARDNGINLAFFSANTAYWRVRFEPSSTGEPNRVMVAYKQDWALDPVAQSDISQATTLFRSAELNRPENSLMGVLYVGDYGSSGNALYKGADFVVTNAADPYYANTGLRNGDVLRGLVGYEWDAVVNNGATPPGLVVLSSSSVQQTGGLPPLPPGTNPNIANAVRYTAPSGAKVFSTGSIQWMWGLDSDNVTNPREDPRAKQIAVNVFADMGAKPQTPSTGIIVPR